MASTMTLNLTLILSILYPSLLLVTTGLDVMKAHAVTKDPCNRYDVDGCSIPFGLPFFFKGLFTHSCNRHDICYHCGVAYDIPKPACDEGFKKDMNSACKNRYWYTATNNQRRSGEENAWRHRALVLEATKRHHAEFLAILDQELPLLHFFLLLNELETDLIQSVKERVVIRWAILLSSVLDKDVDIHKMNGQSYKVAAQIVRKLHERGDHSNDVVSVVKDRVISLKFLQEHLVLKEPQSAQTGFDYGDGQEIFDNRIPMENPVDQTFCEKILAIVNKETKPATTSEKLDCEDVQLLVCSFFAEVYFLAVHFFAASSYHHVPEFYCHDSFVPPCLPHRLA